MVPMFPTFVLCLPHPFLSKPLRQDTSRGAQDPWWPVEERATTGPFGLRRQFVYESPPRVTDQRNMQVLTNEEFTLTQQQKKALKKLRIEIYNPIPNRPKFLYYRDLATIRYNEKEKKKNDEDGKRCAICLEDFEPRQEVTLTPCNHMFHENCIVPWVKDHSQCPACRFEIF